MKTDTSNLLDELLDLENCLRTSLKDVTDEIRAEHERLARENYGVYVSCIVLSEGKRHRVTGFTHIRRGAAGSVRPWVDGNPERKDGTFGTAVRHLYGDWILERGED